MNVVDDGMDGVRNQVNHDVSRDDVMHVVPFANTLAMAFPRGQCLFWCKGD
jgi:hypothetical protein